MEACYFLLILQKPPIFFAETVIKKLIRAICFKI